jgi:hypothetical protein
MKYIIIIFLFSLTISVVFSKSCGVSSIYTPKGHSTPVIIYTARVQRAEFKFTVMNQQLSSSFQVNNEENILTDKATGEIWFTNKTTAKDKNTKNVLNLCRNLHLDNIRAKLYNTSTVSSKYSSDAMPKNLSLRTRTMSSFLQINKTENIVKESSDEIMLDRLNQEVEQELEASMKPLQKNDEFEALNNEANMERVEKNNNNALNQDNIIFG